MSRARRHFIPGYIWHITHRCHKKSHNGWIEEALRSGRHVRESKWVQSVAVGSEEFIEITKERLGFQVKGRRVSRSDEDYQLREQQVA